MIESLSTSTGFTARRLAPPRRRAPADQAARHAVPVFAVTSGKGGVGKTNVVANLATLLRRGGRRVLAIDADLGLANLDLYLGVKPAHSLADFFAGTATLNEILLANHDGVLVMPGASGVQELTALSAEQKSAFLTELDVTAPDVDLVLVDTGSGISDTVTYFTSAAQEIILVVTPEPASLTDAYALIKVLRAQQREQRFLVLANQVGDDAEGRRVFDILSRTALRFLNVALDYLGAIPRDPQMLWAAAQARPVVLHRPEAPSARAFAALAQHLAARAGASLPAKGNLQFFFRHILAAGKAAQ